MVKSKSKQFFVVAYDIADDRRRARIVKVLERLGARVNFSVFECLLTPSQSERMRRDLERIIRPEEDRIAIYPICLDCFSKISYIPEKVRKAEAAIVI